MPRSAASVTWTIIGAVATILLGLAVVFGPHLYREGRQMVAPIVDLSKAEEELAALDRRAAFTPPADGRIAADRLATFLAVRRDLLPCYQRWAETTKRVERTKPGDSWQAAKEVLGVTREVFTAQNTALQSHHMSRAEFRWLEEQVYDGWLDHQAVAAAADADRRLREVTEEDIGYLRDLRARYGSSRALDELARHLDERLRGLPPTAQAAPDEGPNDQLLREHHDEIAALRLDEFSDLHTRLRQGHHRGVTVRVGEEQRNGGVELDFQAQAAEATPAPSP
jgi:hypothetical protein